MLLSIIIPIYNVQNYITRCLESILCQDLRDVEILIVNDGSTDGSIDVAQKFKESSNAIQIISQKNGGVASARNTGIQHARGKYIMFVDADDQIMDFTISSIRNLLISYENVDCIVGNRRTFYEDTHEIDNLSSLIDISRIHDHSGQEVLEYLYNDTNIVMYEVWKYCVRRSLIVDNQVYFTPGSQMGEDFEWTSKVLYFSNKCLYLAGNHYIYTCNRKDSLMNQYSSKRLNDLLEVNDRLYTFAVEHQNQPLINAVARSLSMVLLPDLEKLDSQLRSEFFSLLKDKKNILLESTDVRARLIYILWSCLGLSVTIKILSFYKHK